MLPPEIGRLENLETLILSRNYLKTLPPEIGGLVSLKWLYLYRNELEVLPPEIGQLTELRVLSLDHNQLETLSIEIGQLSKLTDISARDNSITSLPQYICELPLLESLELKGNRLTVLPPQIGQLSRLESASFEGNKLKELPREIGQLASLIRLDVSNNQLRSVPKELARLAKLSSLDLRANWLSSLPEELGQMRSVAMAAERDRKPYTEGILLEGNPLEHPLPALIAEGQPSATTNVLAWLRGELDLSALAGIRDDLDQALEPPVLPKQGHGPHFEIDDKGVIKFAPPQNLDRQGNNLGRLRKLHPSLQALSSSLMEGLGQGNVPHWHLRDRASAYSKLIEQNLEEIDFSLLYVEGVRLANADRAAKSKVQEGELPSLENQVHETVDSLLQLHGAFMLSTVEGQELLADEERFQRNVEEEQQYREVAFEFAQSLQNRPEIIEKDAATFVLKTTEEIGQGHNPERSAIVANATIKNVAITVSTAAVLATLSAGAFASGSAPLMVGAAATALVAGEGLKKSKSFAVVASLITRSLDKASDVDLLSYFERYGESSKAHLRYVFSFERELRQLAEKGRGLSWLSRTIDWIRSKSTQ